MSADKAQPAPENVEAKSADTSDANANVQPETVEQVQEAQATDAATQASDSLRADSGVAGSENTAVGQDATENAAKGTDANAEATGDAAEATNLQDKLLDDSKPESLEELRKLAPEKLTPAQRARLGLPALDIQDPVKLAMMGAKHGLRPGERSRTYSHKDVELDLNGTKVKFDDIDVGFTKLNTVADVSLQLGDNARSETIEGVGSRHTIDGEDGGQSQVIEGKDGALHIKTADGKYMSMYPGDDFSISDRAGKVVEGPEAQQAFEAQAEQFDKLGASAYDYGMVSTELKGKVSTNDGQHDLVTVSHADNAGNVDVNVKIPEGAEVENSWNGRDSKATLADGTEMVTYNGDTTIRNPNGSLIKVDGSTGEITEVPPGDAADSQFAAVTESFDRNATEGGGDGSSELESGFSLTNWLGNAWDSTTNFLSDPTSMFDGWDFDLGFGLGEDLQSDSFQSGMEDYAKNASIDLENSKDLTHEDFFKGLSEFQESEAQKLEQAALEDATKLEFPQAVRSFDSEMSRITLNDGTNMSARKYMSAMTEGLKGENVTTKVNEDGLVAQYDPDTGLTRIENPETGEITLSYGNPDNPENAFYGEAHTTRDADGKLVFERGTLTTDRAVFRREGNEVYSAEFEGGSTEVRGKAISHRLNEVAATKTNIFGVGKPGEISMITTNDGQGFRNGKWAAIMGKDGRTRVFFDGRGPESGTDVGDDNPNPFGNPTEVSPAESRPDAEHADPSSLENELGYEWCDHAQALRPVLNENGDLGEPIDNSGIRKIERDGKTLLVDSKGRPLFDLTGGKLSAIDVAGHNRGTVETDGDGRLTGTVRDPRDADPDNPTSGGAITESSDFNNGTATQTVTDGSGEVVRTSQIDVANNKRIDRDADGNVVAEIEFNELGQLQFKSGDFNRDFDGTVTNDNGMVYESDGDILDSNGNHVFDSSTGTFGSSWSDAGYVAGRSPQEQAALEAQAESKASMASSQAQAVAAKVASAVQSGNVSAILSSMGEVAAAYGAINGAVAMAVDAGDFGLAGMLNLQTSQVNAAAGRVVATAVKVQDVNRQIGPLAFDGGMSKALASRTWDFSNPKEQYKRVARMMGRDTKQV